MRERARVFRALADGSRLRVLLALRGGELCACHVIALLRLAPSTVSKHMGVLRAAGLVAARKQGRWMHYRLAGPGAPREAAQALSWALGILAREPAALEDARRLPRIVKGCGPLPSARAGSLPAQGIVEGRRVKGEERRAKEKGS